MSAFNIILVDKPSTFSELCQAHHVPYIKGMGYYLLKKKENISSTKELCAYHTSGEFIVSNVDIKAKFGLPDSGSYAPCDIPDGWELYIQSTSPNRKLPKGAKALIRGDALPIPPSSSSASASKPTTKASNNNAAVDDKGGDGDGSDDAYSGLTVLVLKKLLADEGLSTTGSKAALIARLQDGSGIPTPAPIPPSKNVKDEPKKRKAEPAAEPEVEVSKVSKQDATASAPTSITSSSSSSSNGGGGGGGSWIGHNSSMSYKDYGSPNSEIIAGFDMDWTLIRTKSGKTFAQSSDDWKLWDPSVPSKLQQFHNEGKKIVVFTNQNGILKGKETLANIHKKLDGLQALLGVPMLAVIMYGNDIFRKPRIGGWEFLENNLNGGIKVNRSKSIYVGDGAGRVPPFVIKKDFGPGDLLFALNLGTQFNTPEECFLNAGPGSYSLTFPNFDPRTLGISPIPFPSDVITNVGAPHNEIVICIGAPGSGKSSLSKKAFPDYVHINRDKLKTKEKCWKITEEALIKKQSVVVDNQNRAKSDRIKYIELSKKYKIPIRAVRIDMPKELCFHLNEYRALNKSSPENRGDERVPSMVIHGFYKNVQEPTKGEGFHTVSTLGIEHLELMGTEADKTLIRSFLCT